MWLAGICREGEVGVVVADGFTLPWVAAARRRMRACTVLFLPMTCMLAACAMEHFDGPRPVNVTKDQIVGTWVGQKNAGTFVFAADWTLTASDLPADALPPLEPSNRWSCIGTWQITSWDGGDSELRNIVKLDLSELPGVDGGYGGQLSASKPDDVIVLTMAPYRYTKK
jgi:hypothetical protein